MTTTNDERPEGPPDFYNLIAAERGVPEGWRWFELKAIGEVGDRANGAVIIKGAVCTAVFKSGPRKGEKNWSKRTDQRELVVSMREYDAFKEAWSTRTGLCSSCGGRGETLVRASADGNKEYGPCRMCNGTGKGGAR